MRFQLQVMVNNVVISDSFSAIFNSYDDALSRGISIAYEYILKNELASSNTQIDILPC